MRLLLCRSSCLQSHQSVMTSARHNGWRPWVRWSARCTFSRMSPTPRCNRTSCQGTHVRILGNMVSQLASSKTLLT